MLLLIHISRTDSYCYTHSGTAGRSLGRMELFQLQLQMAGRLPALTLSPFALPWPTVHSAFCVCSTNHLGICSQRLNPLLRREGWPCAWDTGAAWKKRSSDLLQAPWPCPGEVPKSPQAFGVYFSSASQRSCHNLAGEAGGVCCCSPVLQQLLTGAMVKSGAEGTRGGYHTPQAVCWCDKGNPSSRMHRFNSSIKERERERKIRHLRSEQEEAVTGTHLGKPEPSLQTAFRASCRALHSTHHYKPQLRWGHQAMKSSSENRTGKLKSWNIPQAESTHSEPQMLLVNLKASPL